MTNTQLDNLINRLNKKIDRVRITLGEHSDLFGFVSSTMGLLKPLGVINRGTYTIKRGKAVNNLSANQRQQLEMLLASIDVNLNKRTLSSEKARLREILKSFYGKSKLGRVTVAEYKKADRIARTMSNSVDRALDFFYFVDVDDSPEKKEAIQIAKISGRKKTYGEMYRIVFLANKRLHDKYSTSPIDIARYGEKYLISDDILKSFTA